MYDSRKAQFSIGARLVAVPFLYAEVISKAEASK
jgi:hypothetical protein